MSINSNIIDQRVRKLAEENAEKYADALGIKNDPDKANPVSFVYLVAKTFLDIGDEEAIDCLVEGGNDFGVDAIYLTPPSDGEFQVTLIQGKYKRDSNNLSGFPENGVKAMISAVGTLFDPGKSVTLNTRLEAKVEEVRSLIAEG